MDIDKFQKTTFKKISYLIIGVGVGVMGAVYPWAYAIILLLCVGIAIYYLDIKKTVEILFWIVVVAMFLGAYLSIPGHESIYLFRILLPLHLFLLLVNQDFDIENLKKYRIYLLLLLLYFATSILSLCWAESTTLGIRYCYFIFEICYLFVICFYHLNSEKQFMRLFKLITVFFSLNLCIGILEIILGWHLPLSGSSVYVTTTSQFQPTGFLFNTNDYALLLAVFYPLAACYLLELKNRKLSLILYTVITIMTIYVVVSTYSRIGMLAIGIGILTVFLYHFKQKGIVLCIISAPIVLILAFFSSFGKNLIDIVYSAFTDKGTSTSARGHLYELLIQIIQDSHFMGIGAGNVPRQLSTLMIGYAEDSSEAYVTGHNFWLETIGNIGVIGFIFCVGIFILYIIQLLYMKSSGKWYLPLLVWISFMGASIALSTILEKRFLWFMIAFGICYIKYHSKKEIHNE
ncbi:O-antigen ligase family protein [Listeria rocourtiae]|uniref:O-antigen ligase family protein n=1 Tax=Listeria rocourtiae TaxID=647910 RepID=UPI00162501D5|nr:O-antigen ligase family protein [Listeria rocourtiae]MBC1435071.1 O-antigen ligase family protein [Listeria rocourtiae]